MKGEKAKGAATFPAAFPPVGRGPVLRVVRPM